MLIVASKVRKFVIRREVQPKGEGKKAYTKAPRIQRLVTPQRLQHKRHRMALKRRQAESSKDAAVSLADTDNSTGIRVVLVGTWLIGAGRMSTRLS